MNIVMNKARAYLGIGVVHAADGVESTKEELMSIAGKYMPRFGIACERSIARVRTVDLVTRLIEIHAVVSPA